MVKLDLEVNEIVGLAELKRIDETKLKKFLKASPKEDLEKYIIASVFENETPEDDPEGNPEDYPVDDSKEVSKSSEFDD